MQVIAPDSRLSKMAPIDLSSGVAKVGCEFDFYPHYSISVSLWGSLAFFYYFLAKPILRLQRIRIGDNRDE
jgi:hypothetical protein